MTATGALDAGFTPAQLEINAQGHCITDEGHPLCNAGTESYGQINLQTALTFSVNTYFAQLGQKLGQARLEATMQKFGFFDLPPLSYPTDEMNPSGLYSNGRLLGTLAPIDVGRVAIGQERLGITPLQMAEVAATVGNGGVRMAPSLVDKVLTPGGSTVLTHSPQPIDRVMSSAAPPSWPPTCRTSSTRAPARRRGPEQPLGGGQDRDGRDGHDGNQHRVVHRLRPGAAPQDRRCGRRRAHAGVRRTDLGAHRRPGDRGLSRAGRGKVADL